MKFWGLGLAAALLAASAANAQVKPPLVITEADYPSYAVANGLQGRTFIEVTVRDDGTVATCKIVRSSGYGLLDDRSCELYKSRARFDPVPANRTLRAPVTWSTGEEGRGDPMHVLTGFDYAYPTLRMGNSTTPDRLSALFNGQCHEAEGFAGTVTDCMGNPALFKGLIAGAGQSVSLSFSHGSNELTGVAYRIQPSQLAAARQVLESRLGAPCYATADQTAWVDGDAFVVLHNNSMAVLLTRAYHTIIDRFDTCPPTD